MRSSLLVALQLLSRRGKVKLVTVIIGQVLASMLDILALYVIFSTFYAEEKQIWVFSKIDSVMIFLIGDQFREFPEIKYIGLGFLLFITKTMISGFFTKITYVVLAQEQIKVAEKILNQIMLKDITFIEKRNENQYFYIFNQSIGAIISITLGNMSLIISEIILLVMLFGVLSLNYLGLTTFILFIYTLFSIFIARILKRNLNIQGQSRYESSVEINYSINQLFLSFKEIIFANGISYFAKNINRNIEKNYRTKNEQLFLQNIPKIFFEIFFIISMLIMGIYLFKTNEYEDALTILAVYFAASFRILPSILKVNNLIVGMKSGISESRDFLKIAEELRENEKSILDSNSQLIESKISQMSYPIILRNISVKYNDKLVIDHVNLKVCPGDKISITGPSGCGKTTLIEASLGLKDLNFGESLIFGKNPSIYRSENPTSISYVGQYPFILDQSLEENIAFGLQHTKIDTLKMNEIINQLDLQHLDKINSLQKIDSKQKFSGGERQRIAIGRALYQNAKILILDEPTSALDEKNETSIYELLLGLPKSITVVVVTHNLNWAKRFDKCFVIDNLKLKSV